MTRATSTAVIIPAAGAGARLCNVERKAWVPLAGRPLLAYALETFRHHPAVTEIILVVAEDDMDRARQLIAGGPTRVTEKVIIGGCERRDSVWRGLMEVSAGTDIVLIHDAARPFLAPAIIDASIAAIRAHGAAVVARPVADTLKRAAPDGDVAATVARAGLWGAQTPQGARTGLLQRAYARAIEEDWVVTDDAAILERAGHRVHLVEGDAMNFKITTPADLAMAERLLAVAPARTGFGYDVHRLVTERKLILGGVEIPFPLGLLGHSDADVLTHAIMDALLGAAALGDIGRHFPDSDPQFRGADSLVLLTEVIRLLGNAGLAVYNVDSTLVAQAPKVAAYIPEICERLAAAMGITVAQVSVKATTTEGLGFTGSGEGMAAYATVSLLQR